MRQRHELDELREQAYQAQGWKEGSGKPRLARAALSEEERRQRDFAEGVEAGLLFALGKAGSPFEEQRPEVPDADALLRRQRLAD